MRPLCYIIKEGPEKCTLPGVAILGEAKNLGFFGSY
jgi:hypothetical protein